MMKLYIKYGLLAGVLLLATSFLSSCSTDRSTDDANGIPPIDTTKTGKSDSSLVNNETYNQIYRPWMHFSPAKNWMNDPNGMVYLDGEYHLFYQYNPYGSSWGNMSWGHAVSKDLIHWEELGVVLSKDNLGDIFSGSCVVDKNNTAGFGTNAIVAIYTSSGSWQQQSIAYSTDKGRTFTKYAGNPVLENSTISDFRDPKVFWYEAGNKWIMSLATGSSISFYSSADLKKWSKLSSFTTSLAACKRGVWECPDLVQLDYKGNKKWILIVNVGSPGGSTNGSGTQYFVGDFDGTEFKADSLNYPLWVDYGMDDYAGVTWSNTPDSRAIFLGWMSNWLYAGNVPTTIWRGSNTLPRELSLVDNGGTPLLASLPVKELASVGSSFKEIGSDASLEYDKPYQLQITLDTSKSSTISLSNTSGQHVDIEVSNELGKLIFKRQSSSGDCNFSPAFSVDIKSPLYATSGNLTLNIYVDRSSVEIFSSDGAIVQTNLIFPSSMYNHVIVTGGFIQAKVREIGSIW